MRTVFLACPALPWYSGGTKHKREGGASMYRTEVKVAALPVKRVFPAHHSLEIKPEILGRMRDVFRELKAAGKLRHGSGKFDYGDWGVWL